ncbi:MAG TPA: dephospho-CoA kinase [Bryobacteraceae bacterium]|jgi:dephospho-CoA kinase|nr:dephospho-CoA kinase [Bryobacteraceae bacterium]
MLRVGLTGGLASGKSFVGHQFAALGCLLIEADELGHKVLEPDGEAYAPVVAEFGREILGPGSVIDRRKLASIVFHQPDRLEKLNSLVHPPVRARTRQLIDEFAQHEPHGIAVIEAAILIETGSWRGYDRLIVAVCSEEQQIERAMARDRLSREAVLDRLSRQMPLADKVKYADYVIDTSGTKPRTIEQTRNVYASLRSLNPCDSGH